LPPEERYPLSVPVSVPPTSDETDHIYSSKYQSVNESQPQIPSTTSTISTTSHSAPEPPPRIDRNNKPTRFRSAQERLFGRREKRDSFNTPDYINTTQKCDSLDRTTSSGMTTGLTNGRHLSGGNGGAFGDSSSYSSDSYNKYGSPTSTLDNKQNNRYNSVHNRPSHDPYRFTRSTAQPHSTPKHQSSNGGSPLKYEKYDKYDMTQDRQQMPSRPPLPPSPPPKPNNYTSK
jgi:hypothetical protein